ncbi:lantibiotic dehydratase [Spirosoma fluviale]|uniref:Thiopeptide-type bacteriocin biosynthesis domain-containing protein n=1 Tax=Spirosoma fluviale TaxID=1597977 RepID=A0A286F4W3_9BACT|nr:lantibiotic dehydratase [Spirosoma fluviale]SOD78270.1 thiopeptide-type bacteriocin biosynthesis domain-containing protein [Spirosoma fluviale]
MFRPKNFFVLRQPTFPVTQLANLYKRVFQKSLESLLRQHYQQLLAQQAIWVASPVLYERLQQWLAGKTVSDQEKLIATLHKYFIRMCSRPTPYGLFAGCSVGTLGGQTNLRAGNAQAMRTHMRIDMHYLLAIRTWLLNQPAIRPQLRLFPNSSIYSVGASLRYVEQQVDPSGGHYFISAVETNSFLTAILKAARTGATMQQLADQLVGMGAHADEAVAFVEQLIEGQLLTFAIEPTVTGTYYLTWLTDHIATMPGAESAADALRRLQTLLDQPNRLESYAAIRAWFAEQGIPLTSADIIQVDTYFDNPDLRLGERPLKQLQRDLSKLMVLNQPNRSADLDEFKRRFYNRYEDEEVPLARVIDSEFGVGYGTNSTLGVGYAPLIDDLTFGHAETVHTTRWDWWQRFVMDKYADALRTGRNQIALTDADLHYIESKQTSSLPLPSSFYVFGTFVASSASALDEGDFLFKLLACKGPSALNLMGRFGGGSPELAQQIRQAALDEEAHHPEVVIAEIVHLPEDRAGNILTRPTIHTYEIPYMGQSSVPLDYQIPLSDLMVSVRNDTIILRSKRLNRRVIPRLTTAHNFTNGLPIYRFLCDLQQQDAQLNVAWNWGGLHTQPYLPRVCYKSIILSRATWQLQSRDLTPENPLQLVSQLTAAGLPQEFRLAQGDNELLISLHIPASLELLAAEIKKYPQIRLVEFLSTTDGCPLAQKGERFTHEVIIPFTNPKAPALSGLSRTDEKFPPRRFSVGSEWFYLKLYTGEKTSDALLVQTIYPIVQQLLKSGVIQEFFFVRYKDTDHHLRLRFRGNPHVEFYQYVVRAMTEGLHESIETGVVHRVQVDTYQRELERYSMEHINLCESLFHLDSLSTLAFLAQTGEVFDENLRVALAIRKIDTLLSGAGLSIEDRLRVMKQLKEQFFDEFGGDPALRHQLNDKYRTYRPLLAQALSDNFMPGQELQPYFQQQATLLHQLAKAHESMPRQQYGILTSLIHMLVNRLFPSKQRAYELVLYHCLARHYDSVCARQKE